MHPGPAKSKQCREVELALCFLCRYVNNGMYAMMGTVGATAYSNKYCMHIHEVVLCMAVY